VEWVAQCGAYADLTSILNGADHLALEGHGEETGEGVYVVFGDNLYPSADPNPLVALRQAPPGVAVLARAYQAGLAQRRGVIVTAPGPGGIRRMVDLVEKPGVRAARALQDTYGGDNLMLLEGRVRVDGDFVDFARGHAGGDGGEPKLSLVLAAYARRRPVWVVGTAGEVVDLGAPAALDAS
jgi:UTP-glucose-1-phosphate uridylyltransferase